MYIIKMYGYNIRLSWKSRIVYPGAFMLAIIMQLITYFSQFITMWILLSNFTSIKTWSTSEVIFLYSMQLMTYSIAAAFTANTVNDLPDMVKNGQLDEILSKPLNPFIYLLSMKFNVGYIAHFCVSFIIMILNFSLSEYAISITKIVVFFVFLISGSVITGSLMLITTIPCIYLVGTSGCWRIFYDLRTYTNYPLIIFNDFVQFIFTCIIPFAFVSYYPCRYLFGKVEGIFPFDFVNICSPIVAIILVIITRIIWNKAIKMYDGSGT